MGGKNFTAGDLDPHDPCVFTLNRGKTRQPRLLARETSAGELVAEGRFDRLTFVGGSHSRSSYRIALCPKLSAASKTAQLLLYNVQPNHQCQVSRKKVT